MRYANVKLVMNTLCLEPKLEIYIYILLFQRMPAILYFFYKFGIHHPNHQGVTGALHT